MRGNWGYLGFDISQEQKKRRDCKSFPHGINHVEQTHRRQMLKVWEAKYN